MKAEAVWSEGRICRALARQTFSGNLVVVPNCNWTGYEADLLVVTPDLRLIDVEVKISRADFRADAKKEKWWHRPYREWNGVSRTYDRPNPVPRPWPPKIWKHYYALPADVWRDDMLDMLPSKNSGVLLLREPRTSGGFVHVESVHRSKPNRDAEKIPAEAAVNIARLASLRMWDALHELDAARAAA